VLPSISGHSDGKRRPGELELDATGGRGTAKLLDKTMNAAKNNHGGTSLPALHAESKTRRRRFASLVLPSILLHTMAAESELPRVKTGPIHVAHWGTKLTTPLATAKTATVKTETRVVNGTDKDAAIEDEEDTTRAATAGINNTPVAYNGYQTAYDVFGFNYRSMEYARFHQKNPTIPVYGSETASTVSSRGEYFFPVTETKNGGMGEFQMSSYDLYAPRWAWPPGPGVQMAGSGARNARRVCLDRLRLPRRARTGTMWRSSPFASRTQMGFWRRVRTIS
jgi:hypothetical protein